MRFYSTILIALLLLSVSAYSQTITELIVPQYIQGINSTTATRVPFIYRLKIEGLVAGKTYRYFFRLIDDLTNTTSTGEGGFIYIKPTGEFKRINSPSLGAASVCGELTADATGSYTGWFGNDAGTGATSVFTPGKTLYLRMTINRGDGTSTIMNKVTLNTPIKVINFGSAVTDGTALRSTPAAGGAAKNFVLLYDNTAGTGQPVTGTYIESDGVAASGTASYAPFYLSNVDGIDKAWGTIIPNELTSGIKKIAQYGFDGSEVASRVSSNGQWPAAGGGTVNTVLASGGASNVIVLDGNVVTLAPGAPIKLTQQITFNDLPVSTYGDADFDAAAMASSGLAVTYQSSDPNVATIVNGHFIHIVGAGTAAITAQQTGDDNYEQATPVTKHLVVNKANVDITAEDKLWVQGMPQPTLTLVYSGFKNGDDETDLHPQPQVSTKATASSPVGSYDIEVAGAGSPNYNLIYHWGVLKVIANKQPQTITFTALPNKTYGDADYNPGATASSKLKVSYISSNPAVATVVNDTLIHVVAPGRTIISAQQGGDNSYEAARSVDQQLEVVKASLQITAEDKTRLVAQPNPTLTIRYSGFVKNETVNDLITQPVISTTADISSSPGTYVIKVESATSNNYDITHINGILTVTPLPAQQITFYELPVKKYGDADFKPDAKASSGLPVSYTSSNPAVAVIVDDTAIHITGAGTAQITASQAGDAFNGPANRVTRTLTVQKVVLNIRADNKSKNEGEENPPLTVTYIGFVNNDDATALTSLPIVTTTATTMSVAGNYGLLAQGAASNNYIIQYQQGILTILPAQGEGQDNVSAYISAPGQLQVNMHAVNDVKTAVQLFDLNGTRLVNTTISVKKGINTYRLAIGNIAPGIYNLRIAGNGIMLKTKIVIR